MSNKTPLDRGWQFAAGKLTVSYRQTHSFLPANCQFAAVKLLLLCLMVMGNVGAWAQTTIVAIENHIAFSYGKCNAGARAVLLMLLALFGANVHLKADDVIDGGYYYLQNKQDNNQYYMVPARQFYYQDNEETPYVTSVQTAKDANSVWQVVKATVDGEVYYRFIHVLSGKYLTAHGVVNESHPARRRLHLEAFTTPTDATLFFAKMNAQGNFAIRPKDIHDETNNYWWLDIAGGNKGGNNNYASGDNDITKEGILGLWNTLTQDAYKWLPEEALRAPSISYSETEKQFTISHPEGSAVSIYYTTDGSTPTTSSTPYTAPVSAEGIILLRAIAVRDGMTSGMVEMFNPSQPLLFKTTDAANESYYMMPPVDYASTTDVNVSTSNVPNPRMQWWLKPAKRVNEVQYYYFVNAVQNSDGKDMYLYARGNSKTGSALVMKEKEAEGTEPDRYMFHVYPYSGYVNIIPKFLDNRAPAGDANQCLYKQNNNDNHANPIGLYSDNTNGMPRWAAIAVPADPRTLSVAPFASTELKAQYFKLRSAPLTNNNTYYVYPPATEGSYATANTTGNNPEWYLEPADDDDPWTTYYYLRNAATGRYFYFDGVNNNSNDNKFFLSDEVRSDFEDKYKFLFVKTANTTYTGTWHIISKLVKDQEKQNQIALNRNNNTLKTYQSRASGGSCWYIDATTFKCQQPVITFDAMQGIVTMTSGTSGADIYYIGYDTADGAKPNLTTDENRAKVTKYTGPFYVGNTYYKAIAARSYADGSDQSDVAEIGPLANVTCATPQITTVNNKVTITCSTQGVTIYYTTDGSTPTSASTKYEETFSITEPTAVKAFAVRAGLTNSEVAAETFERAAIPVIKPGDNGYSVEMTCDTENAKIYYTTDGSTPTIASAVYTAPLTEDVVGKVFKAVAICNGHVNSEIGSGGPFSLRCATPTFIQRGKFMEIACVAPAGATIRYTLDGSTPNSSSPVYSGPLNLSGLSLPLTIKAYATAEGYNDAQVGVSATITSWGNGTEDNPIIVSTTDDFAQFIADVNSDADKAAMHYVIANDITLSGNTTISATFTGSLTANTDEDGRFYTISGLSQPLFNVIDGAVVSNIMLDAVTISSGNADGNTGAIACEATGNSRIYNVGILGGTVSGSGYTGGLVGKLDGEARVINCFSYADITGGTTVGGIVGYNNIETTQKNLKTMVMNCMMYGDITGGTNVYPVYGGKKITNKGDNAGVNNYNFYRDESKITVNDLNHYNCSWPVEEENLTRFDYVRSALNANRELCAWWITGNTDNKDIVAKWVYAPQEKPHPILKRWGRYPSMINRDIDGESLYSRTGANDYEGKALGSLAVTVTDGNEHTKTLPDVLITDMDTLHYDYGYYKIQLPYYNSVFGNPTSNDYTTRYGGNYTDKVVVGWEVTAVTGGAKGSFSTDSESGYNFADRYCTQKDIYDVSGRIFAQGGYYYVPEGVTGVTIKAHWAKAYYCANEGYNRDRIDFNPNNNTTYAFTPAGTVANTFHGQSVYAGLIAAQNAIKTTGGTTVYDNAIVLVGNVQHRNGKDANLYINGKTKGFTIMSVDLDFDDEPDYVLPLQTGQSSDKPNLSPIRFDFVQVPDLGMVLKRDGDKNRLAVSCIYMSGHFEITETSSLHFNELYFGNNNTDKLLAPVIFNGGQTLEFVAGEQNQPQERTQYIIAGGNAHMRSLYQGNHNRQTYKIKHAPMSVMGGEFDECYLSGNIRSLASSAVYQDSPRLYTNGGRFAIIAGAGQESINGSVHFQIDHSIIDEFYGGATSEGGVITGNIDVQIDHSRVGKYCGGPMVGNMTAGKTITTRATGTTFGQFFGAGNGGTSFSKIEGLSADLWSRWSGAGSCFEATDKMWELSANYSPMRWNSKGNNSYEARYHFEIWQVPSGTAAVCAARRYVYGAQFAATKAGSVTSTLTDCIFEKNFYGGGNLGAVEGNVTSTLTDCTVKGSVFGAGYSAAIPYFECYPLSPESFPWQDPNTSICHDYKVGTTERYTWTNEGSNGDIIEKDGIKYAHTDYSLTGLGSVTGNAKLTLEGNTTVGGNVYGGGDESALNGNATVTLQGNAYVEGDVYGGGALANANIPESGALKTATVNLVGGTVDGDVYGGGLGRLAVEGKAAVGEAGQEGYVPAVEAVAGVAALVGNTEVHLNRGLADDATGCVVKGRIFGCNNLNGTPQGSVLVHVYATQNADKDNISTKNEKTNSAYDVAAVYGGGNLAAYEPTAATSKATVIIDGCDLTSIESVYGGGNAASVPATEVTVNGTYEIGQVFGGGNGKDALPNGDPNPGANVGYKADGTTSYGAGTATTNIYGGTVHYVFGGSNTLGNVRERADVYLDEVKGEDGTVICPINIDEVYGSGNEAFLEGDAKITLGCVNYLGEIYGGAKNAGIGKSIELNITSGKFGRVFGGNNLGGSINGTITVNIEEVGCYPIIIGELYAGGNQAAYPGEGATVSQPTTVINVHSCTSIGTIYGGGLGEGATVTGLATVNIDEVKGKFSANTFEGETITLTDNSKVNVYGKAADAIGAIGTVFGGGNEGNVSGNTQVNIATNAAIKYASDGTGATDRTVEGADIRGNVYGGGNKADVTGQTHVVVGPPTE